MVSHVLGDLPAPSHSVITEVNFLQKLPLLSVDLIKKLDELYPDRCPSLTTPEREIWFNSGARSVVNFLLSLLQEHEDNILTQEEVP